MLVELVEKRCAVVCSLAQLGIGSAKLLGLEVKLVAKRLYVRQSSIKRGVECGWVGEGVLQERRGLLSEGGNVGGVALRLCSIGRRRRRRMLDVC